MKTVFYSIICIWFGAPQVINAIHAQIGKYPDLKNNECGIGWLPLMVDDSIFEWTKFGIEDSGFINARNAINDDVPYVVPLISWSYFSHSDIPVEYNRCFATVLNSNWIITSDECIDNYCVPALGCDKMVYIIYPGEKSFDYFIDYALDERYGLNTTEVFIIEKNGTKLALLKFNESITLGDKPLNTVCLPLPNIINTADEYGLVSGYGMISAQDPNNTAKGELISNIQVGWLKMPAMDVTQNGTDPNLVYVLQPIMNRNKRQCIGGAGAPLIQFVDNRAVLVGLSLTSDTEQKFMSCFLSPWNDLTFAFARVSHFIDLIIDTVKNNPI